LFVRFIYVRGFKEKRGKTEGVPRLFFRGFARHFFRSKAWRKKRSRERERERERGRECGSWCRERKKIRVNGVDVDLQVTVD